LKWLRENGCSWDAKTCQRAAGEGHLEILKWKGERLSMGWTCLFRCSCRRAP